MVVSPEGVKLSLAPNSGGHFSQLFNRPTGGERDKPPSAVFEQLKYTSDPLLAFLQVTYGISMN